MCSTQSTACRKLFTSFPCSRKSNHLLCVEFVLWLKLEFSHYFAHSRFFKEKGNFKLMKAENSTNIAHFWLSRTELYNFFSLLNLCPYFTAILWHIFRSQILIKRKPYQTSRIWLTSICSFSLWNTGFLPSCGEPLKEIPVQFNNFSSMCYRIFYLTAPL